MWIEYYFLFLTAIWYWTLTYENQFHDVKNVLILRYYFKCPGVLPGCWETQSLSNKNSAGVEAAEGNKQNSKYSITQKYPILYWQRLRTFPGMRILVMLLLDTLPMLGNVLLLCFFVFFIFGIIGVQLWAGLLRQRCYINETYQRNLMAQEGFNQ